MFIRILWGLLALWGLAACDEMTLSSGGGTGPSYRVVQVIDGDTIDIDLDGETVRVRYVGMNTPERDEPCYQDAVNANRALVEGKRVQLAVDTSDTDRFGRLLRYIYVNGTFVNEQLVREGWAEAVRYDPDDAQWSNFVDLEASAARAGRGCHPTGIFNDGSDTR